MRKSLRSIIAIFVVAAASLFVMVTPALADHSVTYSPDFSSLPPGWLVSQDPPITGSCTSASEDTAYWNVAGGQFFVQKVAHSNEFGYDFLHFYIPVYETGTLTHFKVHVHTTAITDSPYPDGYVNLRVNYWSPTCEGGQALEATDLGGPTDVSVDGELTLCTVCDFVDGGYFEVELDPYYAQTVTLTDFEITATVDDALDAQEVFNADFLTTLTRPVNAENVLSETTSAIDGGQLSTITTTIGAPVHSAFSGIIDYVRYESTGFTVGLETGVSDVVIYMGLQTVYAETGDSVSAGCLLGLAPLWGASGPPQITFANLTQFGDWREWHDSFDDTPCNTANNTANCLTTNPDLNISAANWSVDGGLSVQLPTDASVDLEHNESIHQRITLDPETSYYVTVIAAPQNSTHGQVTVTFGDAEAILPISVAQAGDFEILDTVALSPGTEDFDPNIYDVRITNTYSGVNNLRVTFICLHEGDVQIAPGSCYWPDPAMTTDEWTITGASFYTPPNPPSAGFYTIANGEDMYRAVNISAYADADQTFNLKLHVTGIVPSLTTSSDYELDIDIVDHDTRDVLQSIGTITEGNYGIWFDKTLSFTITAAGALDGDLQIHNASDELTTDVIGVSISGACLSTADGIWPGFENSDTNPGNLIQPNCEQCVAPADWLNVAGWLQMIICTLRNLWFCYAAILVNGIWSAVLAVMTGLGLMGRWASAAISVVFGWLWTGLGRLLSQLITWLIPIINIVLAWLQSLPFVQSLIDTAGLAAVWFAGIWNFVLGVVNLFVSALRFIGVLFGVIGSSWAAFIAGLSHASEVTFSFPNCSDPETFLYDACLPFDVVNFMSTKVVAFSVLMIAIGVKIGWNEVRKAWNKIQEAFSG